jgi:hypothetical protein
MQKRVGVYGILNTKCYCLFRIEFLAHFLTLIFSIFATQHMLMSKSYLYIPDTQYNGIFVVQTKIF